MKWVFNLERGVDGQRILRLGERNKTQKKGVRTLLWIRKKIKVEETRRKPHVSLGPLDDLQVLEKELSESTYTKDICFSSEITYLFDLKVWIKVSNVKIFSQIAPSFFPQSFLGYLNVKEFTLTLKNLCAWELRTEITVSKNSWVFLPGP